MQADAEERYLEVKRRLDMAAGRLTSLDAQIVDLAGAMAYWRASWRRTNDPEAAVARVLGQPWPDHSDIVATFEEWLLAYREAIRLWGELPAEAQLRLNQPTQRERSPLP